MIVVLCDFHRLQGKSGAVFFTSLRLYPSQFISGLYNDVMPFFVRQNPAVHMAQLDTFQEIPYFHFIYFTFFSVILHVCGHFFLI